MTKADAGRLGGQGEASTDLHLLHPHPPLISTADAARMLNVSERRVKSARHVQEDAPSEIACAVDDRLISVSLASKIADLPENAQAEIIAAAPDATRSSASCAVPSPWRCLRAFHSVASGAEASHRVAYRPKSGRRAGDKGPHGAVGASCGLWRCPGLTDTAARTRPPFDRLHRVGRGSDLDRGRGENRARASCGGPFPARSFWIFSHFSASTPKPESSRRL